MNTINFEDLKGKVCVITGGSGILGSAVAMGLGKVGVKTAIVSRGLEKAQKVAENIQKETGTLSIAISADVLDKESVTAAKKIVNEKLGKVSLLINGAGGNSPSGTTQIETMDEDNKSDLEKSFFGLKTEGFQDVFNLNFLGTLIPTDVFSKDMLESGEGAIMNFSSMSAYHPLTKVAAYSAAKAAVNNFTEWLSVHFAKVGIRVNGIAPGFFLTDQNRFLLTDEKTGNITARGQKILAATPMGRFGDADELIGTSLFLLSQISKFVTGITIPVDGGFNAYSGV